MVAASESWKKGLSLDYFALKAASPLPRVAELHGLGACSRTRFLQADVLEKSTGARLCAACADKCAAAGSVERRPGSFSFFVCGCAAGERGAAECACAAVETPPEQPSRLVRLFPVYQVDESALKLQYVSDVDVRALTPANHPCPPSTLTYFEMRVVRTGEEGFAAIGLVEKSRRRVPMMPGWYSHSFGLHGDDGNLFFGRSRGTPEGAFKNNAKPYGDGDVIGCGYDPTSKHVFFTRNGALVSHCASAVVPRQYYPCVALLGLGTSVELNFAGPFRFAIEGWTNRGADECEEIDSTRKKLFNED